MALIADVPSGEIVPDEADAADSKLMLWPVLMAEQSWKSCKCRNEKKWK